MRIGYVRFTYESCDVCTNWNGGGCALDDQEYKLEVEDEDVYCLDFKEKEE